MAFRIGQRVVSTANFRGRGWYEHSVPKRGQVYTIREIEGRVPDGGLRFDELRNEPNVRYADVSGEVCFNRDYFRPVADISRLVELCDGKPRPGLYSIPNREREVTTFTAAELQRMIDDEVNALSRGDILRRS